MKAWIGIPVRPIASPESLARFVAVALLLATGGCDGSRSAAEAGATAAAARAPAPIELIAADAPAYRRVLEKHRGKVILVDFWATWCGPCVKLFPHVVELGRKHAADGLVVVSVSLDSPEEREPVLAFLRKQGATFDNLVSQFGAGTKTADEFELRGDVPLYKLYDRVGKLRAQFSAEPDGLELGVPIERVDEKVKALLGER